jgi:hypothetical protein
MNSETQNLPTMYIDPLEELAAEARNDLGAMLKFVKGKWTIGDDEVPAGTEFIVHIDHLVRGWIRFEDKKVVERILLRRDDRKQLPDREDLSYASQDDWPRDSKGVRRDPWAKQFFVPLLSVNDGTVVTFVTGTVGGRIAVGKLCDVFLNNDRKRPIVTLDVSDFKTKDYGTVESPSFKIISFEDEPAEPPPTPESVPPTAATTVKVLPAKKAKKSNNDMDDTIPFN